MEFKSISCIKCELQFYGSFYKCAKRRRKTKKLSEFLQACIAGIAWVIFFKFGI